jgi:hypothetical protein
VTHRLRETKPQTVGHSRVKQSQNRLGVSRGGHPPGAASSLECPEGSAGRRYVHSGIARSVCLPRPLSRIGSVQCKRNALASECVLEH